MALKDFIEKIRPYASKWLKLIVFTISVWAAIIFVFFAAVLPIITRHAQLVKVPNVCGMSAEEAISFLEKKSFKYQKIPCSIYKPNQPLHAILEQYPKAGSAVKKNRKIYLTENCNKHVYVSMPSLVDNTIRNAYLVLKSKNLEIGKIEYVQDIAHNGVLGQFYDNEKILAGKSVEVGSKIDLVIGINSNTRQIRVPKITFLESIDELAMMLLSNSLRLGVISYIYSVEHSPGAIISQVPEAGTSVPVGATIDFCVASGEGNAKGKTHHPDQEISAE